MKFCLLWFIREYLTENDQLISFFLFLKLFPLDSFYENNNIFYFEKHSRINEKK